MELHNFCARFFLMKHLIIKQLGCQVNRINWRISNADSKIWSLEIQWVCVGLGEPVVFFFFLSYSCDHDVLSSLGASYSLCNSLTFWGTPGFWFTLKALRWVGESYMSCCVRCSVFLMATILFCGKIWKVWLALEEYIWIMILVLKHFFIPFLL